LPNFLYEHTAQKKRKTVHERLLNIEKNSPHIDALLEQWKELHRRCDNNTQHAKKCFEEAWGKESWLYLEFMLDQGFGLLFPIPEYEQQHINPPEHLCRKWIEKWVDVNHPPASSFTHLLRTGLSIILQYPAKTLCLVQNFGTLVRKGLQKQWTVSQTFLHHVTLQDIDHLLQDDRFKIPVQSLCSWFENRQYEYLYMYLSHRALSQYEFRKLYDIRPPSSFAIPIKRKDITGIEQVIWVDGDLPFWYKVLEQHLRKPVSDKIDLTTTNLVYATSKAHIRIGNVDDFHWYFTATYLMHRSGLSIIQQRFNDWVQKTWSPEMYNNLPGCPAVLVDLVTSYFFPTKNETFKRIHTTGR